LLIYADEQVDATFAANSGHPGAPMGMAPVAHVVWNKFMTFNPKNPDWVNRDRFVLSYVLPKVSDKSAQGVVPLAGDVMRETSGGSSWRKQTSISAGIWTAATLALSIPRSREIRCCFRLQVRATPLLGVALMGRLD
jgi:hypothetical protein